MALMRGRARKVSGEVFTSSMADIVFLLIIFFILTYKVEVDKTKMDLPKTTIRQNVPEKAAVISIAPTWAEPAMVVRVSTGEEMALPVTTDEEIVTFASNVIAQNPAKEFIVKADKDVPYERVDTVLDSLKQAKVKVIYLLSEQKTISD